MDSLVVALAIGICAMQCGCTHAKNVSTDAADSSAAGDVVRIGATQPSADVEIPVSTLSQTPSSVTVDIVTIDGPSPQGFVLVVSLKSSAEAVAEIGRVSPFPIDQPGTFVLPIPARALEQTTSWNRAFVRFALEPTSTGAGLPREVTIKLGPIR